MKKAKSLDGPGQATMKGHLTSAVVLQKTSFPQPQDIFYYDLAKRRLDKC